MSASFFKRAPLLREKRGAHSREVLIKYFTSKRGHLFERGALLSIGTLSSKYGKSIIKKRRRSMIK